MDKVTHNCFVRLDTVKFGVFDIVLCCNDGVAKHNAALNLLSLGFCSNTLNVLKKINMKRIRKAEITLNTTKVMKIKRTQKRTKDQESLWDPQYGTKKH